MIVARRLINTRGWQYERARARTHLQPLSMKSILYCIADQDRVRLFMIRGTLPGIVYTLGLQARTRVTRLIFVPRVPSKEKNVQFLSMISDFVPLFFLQTWSLSKINLFLNILFVMLIKRGWFFFMKFGIKYIKQLKSNLKTHFWKWENSKDKLNYIFFLYRLFKC